jgi:hypothetical protein
MPERKPIVMISSTARDLPKHRAVAREACEKLGMMPKMMEHLPASDKDAIRVSLELVDACDIYLGIIAHRYGYVPDGHEKSITEMEYDRAVETKTPRLMFLMHETHPVLFSDVETGTGAVKLAALKERIGRECVVNFFDSPEALRAAIIHSLAEVEIGRLRSRPLPPGYDLDDSVAAQMVKSSRAMAEAFAERVGEWFAARFASLQTVAAWPQLRGNDKAAHAEALRMLWPLLEKNFPGGLYTLDADGVVIHPYAPLFPEMADITGYKAGFKPYFTTCRDTLAPCTADSFTSADRREEIVVVAVPRFDEGGRFIGILDAVIDLSSAPFSKMADAVAATGLALEVDTHPQLYLLDRREIVLGSTRHDRVGKSFAGYDVIEYLLSETDPDPRLSRFGAVDYVEGTPYHTACFWEADRRPAPGAAETPGPNSIP